ncbi:unnamed protein product [Miscanthus lutarioriparius]|uniref:Uncharacterized protein n=1 Tax=Miscanthus lutarioriparius TaxID=422564 RepID=A0A811SAH4_9POAL|nr:unnamed protein product [Miscanthus lutarioriparius]
MKTTETSLSGSGRQDLGAKPSDDDEACVDCLSALPNSVLLSILAGLGDAAAAGRTNVPSRLQQLTLLPELRFVPLSSHRVSAGRPRSGAQAPEDDRIVFTNQAPGTGRDADADAHEAALSYLSVRTLDADAESVAAWLPAVARRFTGHLSFTNHAPGRDIDDDGGDEERGSLELPCLASATSVTLDLGCGLGLAVAPVGVFARLTDISLTSVLFRGPCALSDAVSSPRCPCLVKLTVHGARGLDNLTIRSDSLREMTLDKPVADISAPALKVLRWGDLFDPISVHLGTMKHLESVCPIILLVYGSPAIAPDPDRDCLGLLRCFKTIQHLHLTLAYLPGVYTNVSLMIVFEKFSHGGVVVEDTGDDEDLEVEDEDFEYSEEEEEEDIADEYVGS